MQLKRHCAIAGITIAVLMAVPREAAAFWDWIHELSGPSMMGFGYTCRLIQPTTFGSRKARLLITKEKHGRTQGESLSLKSGSFRVTRLDDWTFTIDVPPEIVEQVRTELAAPDTTVT